MDDYSYSISGEINKKRSKQKKYYGLIICALLLLIFCTNSAVVANNQGIITLTINSHAINFPNQLVIEDEKVVVPLRGVFELLGAKVNWDASQEKITITREGNITEMFLGEKTIVVNGQAKRMTLAPYLSDDNKTMVHIRVVQDAFGSFLEWDQDVFAVNIWDENFVGADRVVDIIGKPKPIAVASNTQNTTTPATTTQTTTTRTSTSSNSAVSPSTSSTPVELAPVFTPSQSTVYYTVQTISLENGGKYVGHVVNGKFHGDGKITWPDGSSYEGQWRSSLLHGYGTYIYSDGSSYVGDFKDGKQHGFGIYTYSDGSSIDGLWQNGRCIEQY
ncbi:MAG: hypothetical protein APF76_08100 [Desulfitibacter sp. BRH_c19]|nr:MAG: hypothetical protein APF76_08100 [Desulfitibacter sp. BRH_c19]